MDSELRRILYKAGNDSEDGLLHWLEREAVLCAGKPVGVGEACEDGMLALDATVVCVAVSADNVACLTDAEEIGQAEVGARVEVLVVEAGLKAGHDRSAGVYVVADLLALAVAEHGDVGQQKSAILAEVLGIEAVFVHEVESEAAAEKGLVETVRGLSHVLARVCRSGPL